MAAASSNSKKNEAEKLICANPAAKQDYNLEETVEAGMVLNGTEIKSIRAQAPNLRDSFVEVTGRAGRLEAWLVNAHIGPYTHGNIWNHEAMRRRKLLLHRHQIERIYGALIREGYTCIPTKLYLKQGRAKVEIALAKGKKKADRRQDIKSRDAKREMDRALRHNKR